MSSKEALGGRSDANTPATHKARWKSVAFAVIITLCCLTVLFAAWRLARELDDTLNQWSMTRQILFASAIAALMSSAGLFIAMRRIYRRLTDEQRARLHAESTTDQVRLERDFAALILDNAASPMLVWDDAGRIVRFNAACERLTGQTESQVQGQHFTDIFLTACSVQDCPAPSQVVGCPSPDLSTADYVCLDGKGERHLLSFAVTRLKRPKGEVLYIASGLDVTRQRFCEQQLRRLATTDGLTGLSNRTQVYQALQKAVNPSGSGAALLFCDLDNFKIVNDQLGHFAGDELLIAMGKRLRSLVRATDVVGRLGGDEFVLLCPAMTSEVAHQLAARVISAGSEPCRLSTGMATVGVSVGIAIVNPGSDPDEALIHADRDMYQQKRKAIDTHVAAALAS